MCDDIEMKLHPDSFVWTLILWAILLPAGAFVIWGLYTDAVKADWWSWPILAILAIVGLYSECRSNRRLKQQFPDRPFTPREPSSDTPASRR